MDGDKQHASGNTIKNESIEFKIKGAASRQTSSTAAAAKGTTTQDACTICLDPISERAVAVPCNHLTFDFLCLVSWLQEQSTCPLCKRTVSKVEYDFRSPEDYKTYHVQNDHQSSRDDASAHARRAHLSLDRRRRQRTAPPPPTDDPSLSCRRHIYRHRLYAQHVGSNRFSQYRSLSPSDFSSLPLQSRTRTFLRRELQIFSFLDSSSTNTPGRGRGGSRDYLIEYIIAILKSCEIRGADGKAEELVSEFLRRENARQLLHELEAWLRSPFATLREWDEVVQYADRGGGGK